MHGSTYPLHWPSIGGVSEASSRTFVNNVTSSTDSESMDDISAVPYFLSDIGTSFSCQACIEDVMSDDEVKAKKNSHPAWQRYQVASRESRYPSLTIDSRVDRFSFVVWKTRVRS